MFSPHLHFLSVMLSRPRGINKLNELVLGFGVIALLHVLPHLLQLGVSVDLVRELVDEFACNVVKTK